MPPESADSPPAAEPPAPGRGGRFGNLPVFALLAIGVVLVVFTVGWGVALTSYSGAAYNVPHQTIAWNVVSDSEVSITFQVNSRDPAACLLTAKDERHVEVGQDEIQVEAGLRDVTHEFATTRRATMVEVSSCREQRVESEHGATPSEP